MSDVTYCTMCKSTINIGDQVYMVGPVTDASKVTIICTSCNNKGNYSTISGTIIPPGNESFVPPLTGSFKPQKTIGEILELRAGTVSGKLWSQFESEIQILIEHFGPKMLEIGLGSRTYKGYHVDLIWSENQLVSLAFPGQHKKTQPPLNIYQMHRLEKMGFDTAGTDPSLFSIKLTTKERSLENVSRIISHTLEFGYLFDPTRLNAITPFLDT